MRIIDPDEHDTKPVKSGATRLWKVAPKIKTAKKQKIKFLLKRKVEIGEHAHHQRFFKPKYKHSKTMDIEELHDGETYCFYEYGPGGYFLRIIPGYRLKRAWDQYTRAFTAPMPMKLKKRKRENPYNNDPGPWETNCVDIILPNGMILTVQPRSATPSYFKNGARTV